MTVRELSGPPAALPLYARALLPALPVVGSLPGVRRSGDDLPDVELSQRGVRVDPDRLAAYAEVCGFDLRGSLPATYPHILAFPLHLAVLADHAFPFPPMGLVHVENRIRQHRPLGVEEVLDLRVRPSNLRPHPKGRQFDFVSTASVDGEVVWEDVSTYLRRGRRSDVGPAAQERLASSPLSHLEPPPGVTSWRLSGDLGRRYAAVSGDRNPIHLYGLTAKAFGFPRQIAHGMWSKARCLAALQPRLPDAFEIAVAFQKPVLLPGTVAFGARREDDGSWVFGLSDARQTTRHLVGTVQG